MGQASGIVPGRGFFPPTSNPIFSHNPNVCFSYGWNWTSGASIGSQTVGPSYYGFVQNLGGFNPSSGLPIGGSGGPFQPTPMGVCPNPQTQGGNNVPFQHPPLGPGKTPTPSNQIFPMVPMGNPYPIGGYQFIPQSYLGGYPYPPNKYMVGGGCIWVVRSLHHVIFKP